MENPHGLAPEMLAFAEYLRSVDALISSSDIADIRAGTKALRQRTRRRIPPIHSAMELILGDMRFNLYRPSDEKGLRAAVFLHGGGWSHLDIEVYDPVCRRISMEGNIIIAAPDYPLVPEVRFPENFEACVRFIRAFRESGSSLGIDTKRFGLMGDSAGANLALGAAILLRDRGESFIDSLGLIYGAYDLVNERESFARYGNGELPMTTAGLRGSRAFYLPDRVQRSDPLASPIRANLANLPRTFLSVASHDNLYSENLAMAELLGYAGVDVSLRVYPKTIHGFFEAESVTGAAAATRAMRDIGQFMAERSTSL
jgi:acetyl esterase